MAHDALGAHALDELGISVALRARPIQAAFASRPAALPRERSCLSSHCHSSGGESDPDCLWNLTVVPGVSGRACCARRGAGVTLGAIRVTFGVLWLWR